MFLTALGRLGSPVIGPSESLDLHVFIDAGGQSKSNRVWGGLALLGARELDWIDAEMSRLRAMFPEALKPNGELKGRQVPTEIAKDAGLRILQQDRRILFWAQLYPKYNDPEIIELRRKLSQFLTEQRPDATHLERSEIEAWNLDRRDYFDGLRPANGHKLISMVAHMVWLFREIERVNLGRQLRSAHVVLDEENLPTPIRANRFLTAFVAAGLQGAGMSFRRTGGCFRRVDAGGCHVTVDASAKSEKHAGLEYADIQIQVPQRQVIESIANENAMAAQSWPRDATAK